MSDLLDKLNVLVNSSLRGVLGQGADRRRQPLTPHGLGKDIDREIAALRQRINLALDDEDRLKNDIAALQQEAADWDRQADESLAAGDDANARYAVQQMQLKQQHVTLLEADLEQHRYAAAELIRQVNELEAVVAEARHQQAEAGQDQPGDDAADDQSLAARLRHVRQTITASQAAPQRPTPPDTVDDQAVDDDLDARRARLSQ